MKDKILLISGCSHAAGSEIDGSIDSPYNRSKSFGNLFANKIGYRPINAAVGGSNNQCISRTVLEWFHNNYDHEKMDVKVLISWTEPTRIDFPVPVDMKQYDEHRNPYSDYFPASSKNYLKVNIAWKGLNEWEKSALESCHAFMADNPIYFEILSANIILQMQYFFKSLNIDYLMCNSTHLLSRSEHFDFYSNIIDKKNYLNIYDNEQSFFTKYKNLGFINQKATWYHHGEEPHRLYSEELYEFYKSR